VAEVSAVTVVATIGPEAKHRHAEFEHVSSKFLRADVRAAAMGTDSFATSSPPQPAQNSRSQHSPPGLGVSVQSPQSPESICPTDYSSEVSIARSSHIAIKYLNSSLSVMGEARWGITDVAFGRHCADARLWVWLVCAPRVTARRRRLVARLAGREPSVLS